MYQALYRKYRPKTFDDVYGQEIVVKTLKNIIKNNKLTHAYLFIGPRGTGKTTIAKIIKEMYSLQSYEFNASSDSKSILHEISDLTKYYPNVILIIDEIHRMKKDTQDYLLPFIEDGRITVIGLTTSNPYIAINKAIRSRLNIYKMNSINENDIISETSILEVNLEKWEPAKLTTVEEGIEDGKKEE